MRVQPFQLSHDDADVLCAWGRDLPSQLFHCLAECKRVNVGADSADALHERRYLDVVAGLGKMLNAAEVETDMQLGVAHGFAFANQVELVRLFEGRVIGAHGDLVAHFLTSSRRFTPGVLPSRSNSGSYSRPVNSIAYSSWISRSIQSAASQRL